MRVVGIVGILLLLAVNAVALLHEARAYQTYLLGAALVLGVVVLVAIIATRPARNVERATAEAARPTPAAADQSQPEAQVVSFLAMLQEKGRLIDFVMDDINAYNDAQVGAAARIVHTGCKAVLQEHFTIAPVRPEGEGSTVQITPGYRADEYRLIGRIRGQAPFSGKLVHRGWKTDMVKLPRILRGPTDPLPTIAPAEVDLG